MILYEWVYDRGKIAEGLFCSEKCAEDAYGDTVYSYKGAPSALDKQESEELAADWKVCYGCGKPLIENCCPICEDTGWHTVYEPQGHEPSIEAPCPCGLDTNNTQTK